jgi:hypothetical protein
MNRLLSFSDPSQRLGKNGGFKAPLVLFIASFTERSIWLSF